MTFPPQGTPTNKLQGPRIVTGGAEPWLIPEPLVAYFNALSLRVESAYNRSVDAQRAVAGIVRVLNEAARRG